MIPIFSGEERRHQGTMRLSLLIVPARRAVFKPIKKKQDLKSSYCLLQIYVF